MRKKIFNAEISTGESSIESKWLVVTIAFIYFIIASIIGSRAFCIGCVISIFLIFILRFTPHAKYFLSGFFIIIIALIVMVWLIKTDSSLGRLLIYKISWGIFKDHWVNGLGIGRFSSNYLYYQAAYFKTGQFTTKELLLADDTQYAFNDYWQFILETGLKGFCILAGGLTIIGFYIRKALKNNYLKPGLLILAVFHLVTVITAALFTHVFDRLIFQLSFLTALTIVLVYSNANQARHVILISTAVTAFTLLAHWDQYIINVNNYKKLKAAKELYQSGYIRDALKEYQTLYSSLQTDAGYVFEYANILSVLGYNNEAEIEYIHGLKLKCSNIYYNKLAECYYKNNKLKQAEECYKIAIYMVPNRFIPRYKLYNFYKETGQLTPAYKTGMDILTLPIKIPSSQITSIKKEIFNNLSYQNK